MSKKEKKDEGGGGGAPEWMTTYGDLVTLLMCFFVLLFAFSTIDNKKFVAVMQSFQGSAGVLASGQAMTPADMVFDGMPEKKQTRDEESSEQIKEIEKLKNEFEELKEKNNMDIDLKVDAEERGLKITFPDNAFFDPGRAELKPSAVKLLDFMSQVLQEEGFKDRLIRIEGHTDNVPNTTGRFPTNWELSTFRATTVLRYFTETKEMKPERFIASGYGEYKPVASNETISGRAQNRRVDIVVLTAEEQEKEPGN